MVICVFDLAGIPGEKRYCENSEMADEVARRQIA